MGTVSGKKRKKLHILVVSQYFYPETFRINDIAAEWVRRGYQVTVLTGIPNYPSGRFYEGYGFTRRRRERWNGIDIIRIPLTARGSSGIGIVMNYLSFTGSGFIWKTITKVWADLVFTFEVSPMTQGLVGVWYAAKHHVPHYIYVTDLWPENVVCAAGIQNRAVIALIQGMADYIYHRSRRILTCSKSFIEPIRKRGIARNKIEFWPQYAEDFYHPVKNAAAADMPRDGAFNLVFAGNVGFAQGLEILVQAAEYLQAEDIRVRFHIIGDGRYLKELKRKTAVSGVSGYFNYISRKPAEQIPQYLSLADALLVILSKSEVYSITIPAKLQSCMACGRPILVSADGEVQDIVRDAEAGLTSNAGDAEGFAENIKTMMALTEEQRKTFGDHALAYSARHFNKNRLLDRMDEIFQGG